MKLARHLPAGTLALVVFLPSLATAQAWTPPKGEGFVTLTLQSMDADNHFASSGESNREIGTMGGRALVLDADFGITEKLALTASLAYVSGKFTEGEHENPESLHHDLPGDDGEWHSSFQDARVALRYMQPKGLWVFTPSAAVVVPLRDYNTLGHAAIGRGLNELQLGLDVGRLLIFSGQPRGWAQGIYRYTFTEQIEGIRANRSNLFFELGYSAHPKLTLRGFADWLDSHGGFEFPQDINAETIHIHDQLAAARWLRLGAGLSIPVAQGVDFFASVGHTFRGENTHDATTISVGTTWGLQALGFGRTKIRFPGTSD